jgi:hypothetical protein
MITCGIGFDIWSFLVGFLGVGMSPIFQTFKLYNFGFGKKIQDWKNLAIWFEN